MNECMHACVMRSSYDELHGGGESGQAAVEKVGLSRKETAAFDRLLRRRFFDADLDGSGALDYAESVVLLYQLARDREAAENYEKAVNDALISGLLIFPLLGFGALIFKSLEGPSGSSGASEADYSMLDSFYFFVISVTTIGFGDIVPSSDASRWAFVLNMVLSLGLVTTSIRSLFVVMAYQPPPDPVTYANGEDDEDEDQALRMTKSTPPKVQKSVWSTIWNIFSTAHTRDRGGGGDVCLLYSHMTHLQFARREA